MECHYKVTPPTIGLAFILQHFQLFTHRLISFLLNKRENFSVVRGLLSSKCGQINTGKMIMQMLICFVAGSCFLGYNNVN